MRQTWWGRKGAERVIGRQAQPTSGRLRLTQAPDRLDYLAELDGVEIGRCTDRDVVLRGGVLPEIRVSGEMVEYRALEIVQPPR